MNTIATAETDVATIVEERYVKLNYPTLERATKKTYTHQEVWGNVERILNEHYGTDYKLKL